MVEEGMPLIQAWALVKGRHKVCTVLQHTMRFTFPIARW